MYLNGYVNIYFVLILKSVANYVVEQTARSVSIEDTRYLIYLL